MDSNNKFDQSVESFSKTILPLLSEFKTEEITYIQKAFDYAKKLHGDQRRISGELYLSHPVNVAQNVLQHNPDCETVAAALLHDVIEDCETSISTISREFGPEVAALVDGVTKISSIEMKEKALGLEFSKTHFTSQIDSYRKLLSAMAGDPRVLIIKLYDRLHNAKTLEWLPARRQKFYALETIEIFAILAERVGMSQVKNELEDRCFPYAYPNEYEKFIKAINQQQQQSLHYVSKKLKEIKKGIKNADIIKSYGRIKHNFSTYKKLEEKNFDFQQIYDIVAIRIIVPSIEQCYQVLGEVNQLYKPFPDLHCDFIAKPKQNGYQSLHTTVSDNDGHVFEIQIRTPEMQQVAEYGIAAHWRYKESRYGRSSLRDSSDWINASCVSELGFSESKKNFFANKIFVFSPQGKIIELPKNSTPLDFAFHIHTQIGLLCFGAKVNGKIVPISSRLKTGDIVEIIKNERAKPSHDWLSFVKTNFARNKIREYFSDLDRPKHYALGLSIINEELAILGKPALTEKNSKVVSTKISACKLPFNDLEAGLVAVGKKDISKNDIIKIIHPDIKFSELKKVKKVSTVKSVHFEIGDNFTHRIANCCKPTERDKIIGYITLQKTITVHANSCREIKKFDKERVIDAYWR